MSAQERAAEQAALSYEISPDVVMLSDSRQVEAESMRTMRTHMMARHLHYGRRGLAVCSPNSGAGCTFTAVNLAVALAQVGVSTLLIDGDLRRPSVTDFIRPMGPAPEGLSHWFREPETDPHSYVHSDILPNLSILYAGGQAANPQEILGGDAFHGLVETCLRDFEFTIIDCAPANDFADARLVSSLLGYGVIVARQNATLIRDIDVLAKQMQADGVGVVGTVLHEF